MTRRSVGGAVAAALAGVTAVVVRLSDDVARQLDNLPVIGHLVAHAAPIELSPGATRGASRIGGGADQVHAYLDGFAAWADNQYGAARERVKEAGLGASCDVLYTVAREQRLPTEAEWASTAAAALQDAGLPTTPGSAPWRGMRQARTEVIAATLNAERELVPDDGEDLAKDIGCDWVGEAS